MALGSSGPMVRLGSDRGHWEDHAFRLSRGDEACSEHKLVLNSLMLTLSGCHGPMLESLPADELQLGPGAGRERPLFGSNLPFALGPASVKSCLRRVAHGQNGAVCLLR